MTWAKVDDRLHSHPKARRAGLEAMGLWALALSFCAAYGTDGKIGREDVEGLAGKRAAALAERLVSVGLWAAAEDGSGWVFHDFLAYNPSAAAVAAERARKQEAGRRGGLAKAASASTSHDTRRGSDLAPASPVLPEPAVLPIPSRPDPRPEIPPNPPVGGAGPDGGDGFQLETQARKPPRARKPRERHEAYGEAIAAGLRDGGHTVDWTGPTRFPLQVLQVLQKASGGLTGEPFLAWLRSTAAAWRRAVEPTYAGGYRLEKLVDWLNAGSPAGRAAGDHRPPPEARTSAQPGGSYQPTGRSLALTRPGGLS